MAFSEGIEDCKQNKKLWLGLFGGNRDKIQSDEDYQKMRGHDSWYTRKGEIF